MISPTHYEVLGVGATASFDEIRKAFRREIARYHPDKVQHLGHEFQEMAALRSAELMEAYKILTDEALRADYDARVRLLLAGSQTAPPPRPAHATPSLNWSSQSESPTAVVRTGVRDLVRAAALIRFRQALQAEFGSCEEAPIEGFDVVCAPSKGRFWNRLPPRILARFVGHVDGSAVADVWARAGRAGTGSEGRVLCVFLIGPFVAPAPELAQAIAAARRKAPRTAARVIVVPTSSRDWSTRVPSDAPPAVTALVARLRQA